ncbi:MAG: Rod shape-determining protein RodA [Parcubacteria group bacterium GW2011_GWC2_39_14]|nr:MAG: Rod shape-determining protein RodA [Parcubacteria group bacterium GW2011_GWC2_39_14]KKR55121.1 MAG: Rod shape-determining protein RodA [Parcubacteria group bacterium GW2011_GWA2_40_23]
MLRNIVNNFRRLDWVLIAAAFLLFCLGLAAIYSVDLGKEQGGNFEKQILFGVIGFLLMFIFASINYSGWRVSGRSLYVGTLTLLFAVLFFGSTIRGTRGWFNFFGLGIQPAELAKVVLIILLAKFFSNRLQQFRVGKHIIFSFILTLIFVIPVFLQPDLGSAAILLGIWFILLLITGVPKKYLIVLVLIFVMVACVAWVFFLADYQKERIGTFLNPTADPLGSGYNVSQSIIGIGSGYFWGRGLGFGSQSQLKFIPESQTDFIFAVIAEELGFLGVVMVLGLFAIIFYRLVVIARKAHDDFGLYLVLGIVAVIFLHMFINIGMNMGIMPVTGISLPFLSYGGSFLLICLIMIGVAESVAVRR